MEFGRIDYFYLYENRELLYRNPLFLFFPGNWIQRVATTNLHRRSRAPCLALKMSETTNLHPPLFVFYLALIE
jgi:hypothetical protein